MYIYIFFVACSRLSFNSIIKELSVSAVLMNSFPSTLRNSEKKKTWEVTIWTATCQSRLSDVLRGKYVVVPCLTEINMTFLKNRTLSQIMASDLCPSVHLKGAQAQRKWLFSHFK